MQMVGERALRQWARESAGSITVRAMGGAGLKERDDP
jgi:hypothetical protein